MTDRRVPACVRVGWDRKSVLHDGPVWREEQRKRSDTCGFWLTFTLVIFLEFPVSALRHGAAPATAGDTSL